MARNTLYPNARQVLIANLVKETGLTQLQVEAALTELSDYGLVKFSNHGMAIKMVG